MRPKARAITPVPNGVGPMTIALLLYNTVWAAKRQVGDWPGKQYTTTSLPPS